MDEQDEIERSLRLELMRMDLNLKTRQAFWETPRNIAILIGAVAAIAGTLGFKLGQQDRPPIVINLVQPPSAPASTPGAH